MFCEELLHLCRILWKSFTWLSVFFTKVNNAQMEAVMILNISLKVWHFSCQEIPPKNFLIRKWYQGVKNCETLWWKVAQTRSWWKVSIRSEDVKIPCLGFLEAQKNNIEEVMFANVTCNLFGISFFSFCRGAKIYIEPCTWT